MSPHAVTVSRRADVGKGLLSLLGLGALVVAVPLLLVVFVGWPLPRSVPTLDEVTTALGDRYVPDRFLVGALAVVCWMVWAELVASVVVEAVALARGRTASQVPLARGAQLAAARLVAGVALLGALFAARGEGPATIRALTPAPPAELDVDASGLAATGTEALGTPAPTAGPTYTVAPRDTLWDISERCLGDPFRWSEIWVLNQQRTMVDGRVFTDPDRIHPGWVLTLPADAAQMVAATPVPATPAQVEEPPASGGAAGAGPSRVEVLQPASGGGSERIEVLAPVTHAGTDAHSDAPPDDAR